VLPQHLVLICIRDKRLVQVHFFIQTTNT
jgi:hypothetical protein